LNFSRNFQIFSFFSSSKTSPRFLVGFSRLKNFSTSLSALHFSSLDERTKKSCKFLKNVHRDFFLIILFSRKRAIELQYQRPFSDCQNKSVQRYTTRPDSNDLFTPLPIYFLSFILRCRYALESSHTGAPGVVCVPSESIPTQENV
jgi:hypothetical protein